MKRIFFVFLILAVILISGCPEQPAPSPGPGPSPTPQPPEPIPKGVLIKEIPSEMDIIFSSIRYIAQDTACLTDQYALKKNFVGDGECNAIFYNQEINSIITLRQLYAMDIETASVIQITNTDCSFTSGQVVDSTTLMGNAACSDTDNDGFISDHDRRDLYFLDLETEQMDCLSCNLGLTAINNPDYSPITKKIIFSAQRTDKFHNYLFSLDAEKNLEQITNDDNFMDFDCAWSSDGTKIVFNKLPMPFLSFPSEVWLMDSDGSNQERITQGGGNPDNEEAHGPYPIGLDADPDLSPDNKQIVFSRLRTGKENIPFGVFELIIVDVETKQEQALNSSFANMIPEWKTKGILFLRQQADSQSAMGRKQRLFRYYNGSFTELEKFPYNTFPIGGQSCSWIE